MNCCITTVLGTCRVCISFDDAKVSPSQWNLCMPETFERSDNHAYVENNFNGMKHFAVYLFIYSQIALFSALYRTFSPAKRKEHWNKTTSQISTLA